MNAGVFVYSFILVSLKLNLVLGHNGYYVENSEEHLEDWTASIDDNINDLPVEYLHRFGNYFSDSVSAVNTKEDNSAKLRFYYKQTAFPYTDLRHDKRPKAYVFIVCQENTCVAKLGCHSQYISLTSIENYTELSLSKAHNIFAHSWYDPNKITVVFCHGFTGHPYGPAVTFVIKFFLKQSKSNVILLNWEHLAAMVYPSFVNSYLLWAAPNANKVGAEFAKTLLNLSAAGMDLNNTHLVGHSLGAHVFGVAGNKIQESGVRLPWITGLDPSGARFDTKPAYLRLQPGSARFVAIIHSDPSKYGSRKELGLVDFWPNYTNRGMVLQTGCAGGSHPRFSPEDLCNHNKCWQFFIDSLRYSGTLLGSHARNFRVWKNYSTHEKRANILEIAAYKPNAVPGNYYFTTAAESPYGLGKDGL